MSIAPLELSRSALLVMDFQGGILGSVQDADALVGRTADVIKSIRAAGGHVGYVRVGFEDSDYAALPEYSKFAPIAADPKLRAAMHADSATTAIDDRVAPEDGDVVVRKTRVGPFTTTDLDEQLRSRNVNTLILAGISTSGVVLSTVRQGADLDYRIVVLSDACADPDSEVHDVLVGKVFPRQADVITAAEVVGLLG
ncbi:cysteine hydrolase family protein [Rhodococcus jostii]|uniref:Nicotinamidase-related amidase n=1 Tax=Rhodococcus jostii TaxID=132919 RepID=A0A1H4ILU7_RHOJO|nr:cysteine hydrolase [Rhodococcus jostii]SEB35051.1 Nicotinamidase-related amidase [Rhodococcus jostii]